ncbi:hypothetical protein Y1Q_0015699 [Alligator mississippiensis]|uniref:Uncharacterized protein n=1 Tax=Alligator mississippiensis TaxID=8496 RepID=A0A151NP97_ALLMI|nr:hypothetical protein Y1Q_0015699 [Alligator mississippiensis]
MMWSWFHNSQSSFCAQGQPRCGKKQDLTHWSKSRYSERKSHTQHPQLPWVSAPHAHLVPFLRCEMDLKNFNSGSELPKISVNINQLWIWVWHD